MVFGHIEHDRGVEREAVCRFELEARQFDRPEIGQFFACERIAQGIERGRRNVARGLRAQARRLRQMRGQGGHRGLAVGAGDADHTRRITAFGLQMRERLGEEFDLAPDRDAAFGREREQALRGLAVRRESRADADQIDAVEQVGAESAATDLDLGPLRGHGIARRRRFARIRDAHARALGQRPACDRDAGLAETEHQDLRLNERSEHVSAASRWTGRTTPASS